MKLKMISIDAAFANMGLARVTVDTVSGKVECLDLKLVSTERDHHKQVRKSSSDLERAKLLHKALQDWVQDAAFAFAEVPSGSQSAVAARGLGVAVGILASCPIPLIEVSPMEVKIAVTGDRKIQASKADMMAWAEKRWPKAPWIRHTRNSPSKGKSAGKWKIGDLQNDNEHMADAMAAVVAGVATPEFQRLLVGLSGHVLEPAKDVAVVQKRPVTVARRAVL